MPAPPSPRRRASTIGADAQVRRYAALVKRNFVSRQLYDDAQSASGEARADVAAQAAALRSAEIDLARTVIRAPISGRIGRSISTTGALVTAAQDDALTTIQRLDPIYVDIQQSSADLLRLREQIIAGQIARATRRRCGSSSKPARPIPLVGSLSFAEVTRRSRDRSQTIRAVFPNPQHLLLPGHVRSRRACPGRAVARHPGPAARGQPRRARAPDGAGRRQEATCPSFG